MNNGEPSGLAAAASNSGDSGNRIKVLVTGWRKYVLSISTEPPLIYLRAGKSSCIKTVFQHLPVKDVPYIGITQRIEKVEYE